MASADSANFTLDTTGTLPGVGGVGYADSADFALNTGSQPTQPTIWNISMAGTNVLISGANGSNGTMYFVLTSTNVALPLTNWTCLATNWFDAYGNFAFTNGIAPGVAQRFYLLQVP